MKNNQVTIHDIARELNITASTVSRALQNNPRISDKTKQAVKEMAEKLNYQPNTIAAQLRKGKGNTIGICIPRINRHFFSNVIGGIESVAKESGFNTIITQSHEQYEKEVSNIHDLLSSRVDGIIMSLSAETKKYDHVKMIIERGIPLIMFDRVCEGLEIDMVVLNDHKGGYKATEHLIEQGCRRIAHFSGPRYINIYNSRYFGYIDALKDGGITIDESLIIDNTLTKDAGYEAAKQLMNQSQPPDAIFASSDFAALGAILYFKDNNIKIPHQVAVCGFANEYFTSLMEPGLTSVEQHSNDMGQEVARLFFKEIQHSGKEKIQPQKIVFNPELIVRGSTKKQ